MEDPEDVLVQEAVRLAREVAAAFEQVTFLLCPDAETQRVVAPDQPDHALQAQLDTAIATTLAAAGVEVAVQIVDRAKYLAWLGGRDSTRDWRVAYRDSARLVRGTAALTLLGVAPSAVVPRRKPAPPPRRRGTPADRLVHAWVSAHPGFDEMLGALLDDGRQGVLDMAIHKVSEDYLDEAIEEFQLTIQETAESAEIKPGAWAELFAVAVFLQPGIDALPDPVPVAAGLKTSGYFGAGLEVSVLPLWMDPDAVTSMTACEVRKALRDVAGGRKPSVPKPLARPPAQDAVVMFGVTIDSTPIPWEEAVDALALSGEAASPPQGPDPVLAMREAVFVAWSDALIASTPALVDILLPTPISRLIEDIEDAGPPDGDEDEVRDFVATAESEAGGEAVVCVPRIIGDRVELSLYTVSGRLLDTRAFGAPEHGQLPDRLREAIAAVVPIIDEPPQSR